MANAQSNLVPSIAQGLSINSSGGLVKSPTPNISVSSGPVTMSGTSNPGSIAQGLSIDSSGNVVKNAAPSVAVSSGPVAFTGAPASPTTGIASQTHTDAQGNSVTTKYQPAPTAPTASVDNSGGTANANYNLQIPQGGSQGIAPQPSSTGSPQNTTAQPSPIPSTAFGGIVGSLTNTAQGNLPIGQSAANIASSYGQKITDAATQAAQAQAQLETTGGPSAPLLGNALAQAQLGASRQQALASGESAALQGTGQQLTAQGQAQSGLSAAGQLSQPAVVSPGQSVFNPVTGQYTSASSGGGNPLVAPSGIDQSTWENYVQMAAQGENSAIPSSITGNANLSGQLNAAAKALNPNYNALTTPLTTQAIAAQNATQGAQYQAQSQEISNALQTMAPITQVLSQFMSSNQLNPSGIPLANTQINKINAQTNPAAVATMNAAISDIRSYAIQILGAQSGANPTDVTNSVNSFDFSNFTPAQLQTFANNLSSLGQYRLSQAQSASNAGYGANQTSGTVNPAQGITATPGSALQAGGANLLNNIPAPAKLWLGGASSIGSDVLNSLGGLTSSVAAGATGGAVEGGLASTVLGI